MSANESTTQRAATTPDALATLRRQYGCGPVDLTGSANALYERHLLFDNVVDPAAAEARERYEALARSVRDVLSQRWVRTEQTYESAEPQARLLPLDGVSDRPLADQQHHESAARPLRERGGQADVPRLARPARGGARRGTGKWRARAAGRVLSRLDGHDAAARDGVRPPVRVRNVPAVHQGRLAARAAGQLAASPRPVGGGPPGRHGRGQAELLVRGPGGSAAADHRAAVDADRHAVRPTGRGLRRQDDQHAPPLGRGRARLLRLPGVQPRRFRRRAGARRSRPSRSRACSIPTTPRPRGRGCGSCRSTFSSPARWPTWFDDSGAPTPTGARFPKRSPSSSTTRTRRWPSPS